MCNVNDLNICVTHGAMYPNDECMLMKVGIRFCARTNAGERKGGEKDGEVVGLVRSETIV